MLRRKVFLVLLASCCCVVIMLLLPNTSLPGRKIGYFNRKRPMTDSESSSYKAEQRERLRIRDEGCNKLTSRKFSAPARFYVDDKHRLMYCFVPKVASTSLKKWMLLLSGLIATDDFVSIPRDLIHENNPLSKLEAFGDGQLSRLGYQNYLKFIFVRHPFERLVSAYHDKFVDNKTGHVYQLNVGREIIRRFRAQPSNESLQLGHDVTFPEFVSYVIDEWKFGRRKLDVHWRPMSDLCLPCSIHYDFIGKSETFNRDLTALISKINETVTMQSMLLSQPDKPATSSKLVIHSFDLLTKKQIEDLLLLYESDFKVFNYKVLALN